MTGYTCIANCGFCINFKGEVELHRLPVKGFCSINDKPKEVGSEHSCEHFFCVICNNKKLKE